jgi:hypothetical protein
MRYLFILTEEREGIYQFQKFAITVVTMRPSFWTVVLEFVISGGSVQGIHLHKLRFTY